MIPPRTDIVTLQFVLSRGAGFRPLRVAAACRATWTAAPTPIDSKKSARIRPHSMISDGWRNPVLIQIRLAGRGLQQPRQRQHPAAETGFGDRFSGQRQVPATGDNDRGHCEGRERPRHLRSGPCHDLAAAQPEGLIRRLPAGSVRLLSVETAEWFTPWPRGSPEERAGDGRRS